VRLLTDPKAQAAATAARRRMQLAHQSASPDRFRKRKAQAARLTSTRILAMRILANISTTWPYHA